MNVIYQVTDSGGITPISVKAETLKSVIGEFPGGFEHMIGKQEIGHDNKQVYRFYSSLKLAKKRLNEIIVDTVARLEKFQMQVDTL
jgi:hypothetical protein